ncbi:putative aec9 [Escherichia coli 2722950]|nr:putative aec9 [Escherichia coli 2722950]
MERAEEIMRGSLLSVIIAEQKKEPEMTVRYYISSADLTAEKFATASETLARGE